MFTISQYNQYTLIEFFHETRTARQVRRYVAKGYAGATVYLDGLIVVVVVVVVVVRRATACTAAAPSPSGWFGWWLTHGAEWLVVWCGYWWSGGYGTIPYSAAVVLG